MLNLTNLIVTAHMKDGEDIVLVDHLSLSVERGKKLAIIGQSGCGKTMTGMSILGLLPDNCTASGKIIWSDMDLLAISKRQRRLLLGRELVLIPQSGADFLNPSRTIGGQMRESIRHIGIKGVQPLHDILHRVGFECPESILSAYSFQLSGGMAQRVVMAISALGRPGLVIADEPTRGIDRENTGHFVTLMNELFSNAAILIITHDFSIASVCDHILVMNNGQLVEYGETNQILNSPKEAYTRQLIYDLPRTRPHLERGYL